MVIDRVPIIDATGMLECVLRAYLVLVRTSAARRNLERAYTLLEQTEHLGCRRKWGRLIAATLVERLRLYLVEGRTTEASACVEHLEKLKADYPAPNRCAWSDIHDYARLGSAYLASAENRLPEAIVILDQLREEAQLAENHYRSLRLSARVCVLRFEAAHSETAARQFIDVLTASALRGVYQSILDQGPAIGPLLMRSRQEEPCDRELASFVQRLIAGWNANYGPSPVPSPGAAVEETLSFRERNVLQLVGKGESNKEIARVLGIAPETVKSHIKNIFAKLAVEKRVQAVSRAQSLGLISTR